MESSIPNIKKLKNLNYKIRNILPHLERKNTCSGFGVYYFLNTSAKIVTTIEATEI